jgi:HK97 family phage prohead protease
MPIPKPNTGESREDFMGRCLSSDIMQQEYSDNSQRFAVCASSFDDKDKKMFDEEIKTEYFDVECELKAYHDDDDKEKDKGMFEGYASIFGNKDLGNDVIEKGAFMRSLRRKGPKKIKMLYQHDTKEPIGVFDTVKEDMSGLYVKGRLAMGTQKGKEVYELMKMGAIDGLSVGYRVDSKGHHYDDKRKYRVLKEVDLMEISAVTFPMNPRARIQAVKSDFTVREWEHKLREVGDLSHSEAKVAASAVHKALSQREVDKDADLLSIINATTQILTK